MLNGRLQPKQTLASFSFSLFSIQEKPDKN